MELKVREKPYFHRHFVANVTKLVKIGFSCNLHLTGAYADAFYSPLIIAQCLLKIQVCTLKPGLSLEIRQLLLHELNLAQRAILPLNLSCIPRELGALVSSGS